jgi:hypothetical protein
MDTESRQQPVADEGADNSDCHVTNDAKAGPSHNPTGQPPSDKTDQQYDKETFARKVHLDSLITTAICFQNAVAVAIRSHSGVGIMEMLIIRRQRKTPMLPAACLLALLCPLVVCPVASPLDVTTTEVLKLVLFGTTQFGLGLVFLVIGGRLVSATENALINTLELPLAVAWVWVCFSEIPIGSSLIGGIIVMAAVPAHVWHSSRSQVVSATG